MNAAPAIGLTAFAISLRTHKRWQVILGKAMPPAGGLVASEPDSDKGVSCSPCQDTPTS